MIRFTNMSLVIYSREQVHRCCQLLNTNEAAQHPVIMCNTTTGLRSAYNINLQIVPNIDRNVCYGQLPID